MKVVNEMKTKRNTKTWVWRSINIILVLVFLVSAGMVTKMLIQGKMEDDAFAALAESVERTTPRTYTRLRKRKINQLMSIPTPNTTFCMSRIPILWAG